MSTAQETLTWGAYQLDDVGRFTLDGIKVMTSWLPGSRVYETLVVAPDDVLVDLGGDTWEHGTSRGDAEAFFVDTVARIRAYRADRVVV